MKSRMVAEIESLRRQDGLLDPNDVAEAASDPKSALHHRFEWDDTRCGRLYRVEQARQLIRELKIEIRIGPSIIKAPAFVPTSEKAPNSYRRLDEIDTSTVEADHVVYEELTRLAGHLDRLLRISLALDRQPKVHEFLRSVADGIDPLKAVGPHP